MGRAPDRRGPGAKEVLSTYLAASPESGGRLRANADDGLAHRRDLYVPEPTVDEELLQLLGAPRPMAPGAVVRAVQGTAPRVAPNVGDDDPPAWPHHPHHL